MVDGQIVIVGAKASNFDDDIRNHPQIVMWESQNEKWTDKHLPANTRIVFMTRWIGHASFTRIQNEARKRRITFFNPSGTGIIARQIKELLNMTPQIAKTEVVNPVRKSSYIQNKLMPLHQFIDWDKSNVENARFLLIKAKEMGITSTEASLANMVGVERKKLRGPATPRVSKDKAEYDVAIQLFDNVINELQDMRDFFIATVQENKKLKDRINNFKKFLVED